MNRTPENLSSLVRGFHRLVERVLMSEELYFPGLEGVIAGETAISSLEGGLNYRGYAIEDLALESSFCDVAYLLLHGELASQEYLADFQTLLQDAMELPPAIVSLMQEIPLHVPAMDVLRTGISALAHFNADPQDDGDNLAVCKGIQLLARIPMLIAARYRLSRGLPLIAPAPELSFSSNILNMITGREPTALEERAFDVSLILYAEHEFNASTFAARVVTSTGSDLDSSVVAAIGALKGPLHGGANERVMEVLEEVRSQENAEEWVRLALASKRRIMGFGHRVYKNGDPRAEILRGYCRELAEARGDFSLEEIAETIEAAVLEEKKLHPNLDWPSARLYRYLGLETELFTPLFVASRVAGWTAHIIEQASNNRLIRPRSKYNGPPRRPFIPVSRRG